LFDPPLVRSPPPWPTGVASPLSLAVLGAVKPAGDALLVGASFSTAGGSSVGSKVGEAVGEAVSVGVGVAVGVSVGVADGDGVSEGVPVGVCDAVVR